MPTSTRGRVYGARRVTSSDYGASGGVLDTAIREPIKRQGKNESGFGPTVNAYNTLIAQSMSEDVWRKHIRDMAHDAGFNRRYHTGFSIKSEPGFPDDVLISTRYCRLIFMEAKRQTGNGAVLSYDQVGYLDDLAALRDGGIGIEVYGAVRPMDRDAVAKMLFPGADLEGEPLHQWCLRDDCARCQGERQRAKMPSGKKSSRRRR